MRKLKVLALLALASLVLVIPASAATVEVRDGFYHFGGGIDVLSANKDMVVIWGTMCPIIATAEYDAQNISLTFDVPEACDPVFGPLGPITMSGHWVTGEDSKRIRQVDTNVFELDDGSMVSFTERFEAVTGCKIEKGFDTNMRGLWHPGGYGGLVFYFSAKCGDEVFGIETTKPVLQWGWGFDVITP